MNNSKLQKLFHTSMIAKGLSMIAAALILSASMTTVSAQDTTGKALKVHVKSGEPQFFMLVDEPIVTFEGTECHINSANLSTKYDMSTIDYAEIVSNTTSIDEQLKNSLVVDLSNPDRIAIYGMSAGSKVTLVNIAGIVLRQAQADSDGTVALTVSDLPNAVYIVSSKETNFKYIKK